MRSEESFLDTGVSATTQVGAKTAPNGQGAYILGGKYWWAAAGTFGGATVALQRLGPDGATYLQVGSLASVTAAGGAVLELPPGLYQNAVTGGTSVNVSTELTRIPEE